eukprot:728369-Hanusia_phi.AAC.3
MAASSTAMVSCDDESRRQAGEGKERTRWKRTGMEQREGIEDEGEGLEMRKRRRMIVWRGRGRKKHKTR